MAADEKPPEHGVLHATEDEEKPGKKGGLFGGGEGEPSDKKKQSRDAKIAILVGVVGIIITYYLVRNGTGATTATTPTNTTGSPSTTTSGATGPMGPAGPPGPRGPAGRPPPIPFPPKKPVKHGSGYSVPGGSHAVLSPTQEAFDAKHGIARYYEPTIGRFVRIVKGTRLEKGTTEFSGPPAPKVQPIRTTHTPGAAAATVEPNRTAAAPSVAGSRLLKPG